MKKLFIVVIATFVFYACGSKKPSIVKQEGMKEITVPFSDDKYQTDKSYYRASNSGTSMDLNTAKKIALMNAKSEIAATISSQIKAVTSNFTQQLQSGEQQEYENKFNEMARNVTNQQLNDVQIIGQKDYKTQDNKFQVWVCIQVSKDQIKQEVKNGISKDDRLKTLYDEKKFEDVYNKEMNQQ